jgi:hypothetical protein
MAAQQPDPYTTFLEAVKKATQNIGENMEGFVMVFSAKKINHPDAESFPGIPDDQLLFTWASGGHPAVVNLSYLEMAVNLLEQFMQNNRANTYVAMEVMKAEILKKLMSRERQRKP